MHNHWDKYLNIRQRLLDAKPSHVVEVGAGTGECTRLLARMAQSLRFQLTIINDHRLPDLGSEAYQIEGISYQEIPKLVDDSVDFCIIDTDHNYWTLRVELDALHTKLKEGGLILLHDVETFYHATGMAMRYGGDTPYPIDLIEQTGLKQGGLMDAVIDFLAARRFEYRLVAFTTESQGACVLKKQREAQVRFLLPGPDPAYASETKEAVAAWMSQHHVEMVDA